MSTIVNKQSWVIRLQLFETVVFIIFIQIVFGSSLLKATASKVTRWK